MFIEVNDLKALIIDLDDFDEALNAEWAPIQENIQCLFISSRQSRLDTIKRLYPSSLILLKTIRMEFLDSQTIKEYLKKLNVHSYETAFVTTKYSKIKDILNEPIGTIMISKNDVTPYKEAGFQLDFKLYGINDILNIINRTYLGYLSEVGANKGVNISRGRNVYVHMILSELEFEGTMLRIISGGRYFKQTNVRSRTHQLSKRILRNKDEKRIIQDDIFELLLRI